MTTFALACCVVAAAIFFTLGRFVGFARGYWDGLKEGHKMGVSEERANIRRRVSESRTLFMKKNDLDDPKNHVIAGTMAIIIDTIEDDENPGHFEAIYGRPLHPRKGGHDVQ